VKSFRCPIHVRRDRLHPLSADCLLFGTVHFNYYCRIQLPSHSPGISIDKSLRLYIRLTESSPFPHTVCRPTPVHFAALKYGTNSANSPSYLASPTNPPIG